MNLQDWNLLKEAAQHAPIASEFLEKTCLDQRIQELDFWETEKFREVSAEAEPQPKPLPVIWPWIRGKLQAINCTREFIETVTAEVAELVVEVQAASNPSDTIAPLWPAEAIIRDTARNVLARQIAGILEEIQTTAAGLSRIS